MPMFTAFNDAVRYALENTDIGTKSSLKNLATMAETYYTGYISWNNWYPGAGHRKGNGITAKSAYSSACNVRCIFRAERGLKEDARTYETQTRRNMLNDNKMPRARWDKVQDLLGDFDTEKLGELLDQFHSIDQAKLAVSTFCKTAEFVDVACAR